MWGKVEWKYEFKEREGRSQNSNLKNVLMSFKMNNDWC